MNGHARRQADGTDHEADQDAGDARIRDSRSRTTRSWGWAILVAEFGDGNYQPVGVVVSINEAREIASSGMRGRTRDLERGKTPACPERYMVWAQGLEGEYITAATIQP